jgi:hypothetical protein
MYQDKWSRPHYDLPEMITGKGSHPQIPLMQLSEASYI